MSGIIAFIICALAAVYIPFLPFLGILALMTLITRRVGDASLSGRRHLSRDPSSPSGNTQ
jgi:hypothetical protein